MASSYQEDGKNPFYLAEDSHVIELVQEAYREGLAIAAICHGPIVLARAGILEGKKATGHTTIADDLTKAGAEYIKEKVDIDGLIATGNWPYFLELALAFADTLLKVKPRVYVVANRIDLPLNMQVVKQGLYKFRVRFTTPEALDKLESRILILGGPAAYEGVGELVKQLLTEEEQQRIWEAEETGVIIAKRAVWYEKQVIVVAAGRDRWATQRAVKELIAQIAEELASP